MNWTNVDTIHNAVYFGSRPYNVKSSVKEWCGNQNQSLSHEDWYDKK